MFTIIFGLGSRLTTMAIKLINRGRLSVSPDCCVIREDINKLVLLYQDSETLCTGEIYCKWSETRCGLCQAPMSKEQGRTFSLTWEWRFETILLIRMWSTGCFYFTAFDSYRAEGEFLGFKLWLRGFLLLLVNCIVLSVIWLISLFSWSPPVEAVKESCAAIKNVWSSFPGTQSRGESVSWSKSWSERRGLKDQFIVLLSTLLVVID